MQAVADVMARWAMQPGRGVIFDFNGTLSDDELILEQVFTELFEEHLGWEMSASDYRQDLMGQSDRQIVEYAVHEHGTGGNGLTERLLVLRSQLYRSRTAMQSPIGPGALELVRRFHHADVPMAIVTGAQRTDVEAVLDNCEVGSMIAVRVTEEDVKHGKPDPDGFLQAAATLGLERKHVLVFEDSIPGATAAANAGMTCIGVLGDSPHAKLADLVAAQVTQLDAQVLAQLTL